jgi:hypothetical protein
MIVARMSLPADLTLAFPSAWPHIRQLVALYDPDDREPDAGPPPGWSRRVELPDDPGVALVRSVRPARTPARRTSPERIRLSVSPPTRRQHRSIRRRQPSTR